jgi:hypothetical protein
MKINIEKLVKETIENLNEDGTYEFKLIISVQENIIEIGKRKDINYSLAKVCNDKIRGEEWS